MSVRRLLITAGLLVVLSACGDDPVQPPPLEWSTSPTASASATPNAESAEDFIRRWVQETNAAQTTGRTAALREITEGCSPCDSFADRVESIYRAGGHIETSGDTVERIKAQGTEGGDQVFRVTVEVARTAYAESSSASLQKLPGGRVHYRLVLSRRGDSWLLADYTQYNS